MRGCFEAGAVATGCAYEIVEAAPAYAELAPTGGWPRYSAPRWCGWAAPGARRRRGRRPLGSTDMGNVTQLLPGIHPVVGIDAGER